MIDGLVFSQMDAVRLIRTRLQLPHFQNYRRHRLEPTQSEKRCVFVCKLLAQNFTVTPQAPSTLILVKRSRQFVTSIYGR